MNWGSFGLGVLAYFVFDIVLSAFLYKRWKKQMGFRRG